MNRYLSEARRMHPQARGCESMTLIQHKHQFGNSATRGGDETRRYHAYLLSVAQLGAYDTAPGMSRSNEHMLWICC